MAIMQIRLRAENRYVILRREHDPMEQGFEVLSTISVAENAARQLMSDADLRLAALRIFQGPYQSGIRPEPLPILGENQLAEVVQSLVDAAVVAHEREKNTI